MEPKPSNGHTYDWKITVNASHFHVDGKRAVLMFRIDGNMIDLVAM